MSTFAGAEEFRQGRSTARITDVVRAALEARPLGLGEAMLVCLTTTSDDAHTPLGRCVAGLRGDSHREHGRLHHALRRIGASFDPVECVWRLALPVERAA